MRHIPFIHQLCSLIIILGSISIYIQNCSSCFFHVVLTACLETLFICYLRMRYSRTPYFKVLRHFEFILSLVRDTLNFNTDASQYGVFVANERIVRFYDGKRCHSHTDWSTPPSIELSSGTYSSNFSVIF